MNARRVSVAARGRVQRRLTVLMLAANLAGIAAIALYTRDTHHIALGITPLTMLLAALP